MLFVSWYDPEVRFGVGRGPGRGESHVNGDGSRRIGPNWLPLRTHRVRVVPRFRNQGDVTGPTDSQRVDRDRDNVPIAHPQLAVPSAIRLARRASRNLDHGFTRKPVLAPALAVGQRCEGYANRGDGQGGQRADVLECPEGHRFNAREHKRLVVLLGGKQARLSSHLTSGVNRKTASKSTAYWLAACERGAYIDADVGNVRNFFVVFRNIEVNKLPIWLLLDPFTVKKLGVIRPHFSIETNTIQPFGLRAIECFTDNFSIVTSSVSQRNRLRPYNRQSSDCHRYIIIVLGQHSTAPVAADAVTPGFACDIESRKSGTTVDSSSMAISQASEDGAHAGNNQREQSHDVRERPDRRRWFCHTREHSVRRARHNFNRRLIRNVRARRSDFRLLTSDFCARQATP